MNAFSFMTGDNERREEELVRKIIDRTKERKITWRRQSSVITASTPVGMQFDFILSAPFPGLSQSWASFVVRDSGKTILQVQHASFLIGSPTPRLMTALTAAVDELFAMVGGTNDEIDEAMKKLDSF